MRHFLARIAEITLDDNQELSARIECPEPAVPTAGRYVLAWAPEDLDAPLATPLFAAQISGSGFLTAPPVPEKWQPGMRLVLHGPTGHGFQIPASARRLALVAAGNTVARLMPLIFNSREPERSIALFADCLLPQLPAAIEINPLSDLQDVFEWADFLACDVPLGNLDDFKAQLAGSLPLGRCAIPSQVLVYSPMPCSGAGYCGLCQVLLRHTWKWVCRDGPVFEMQDLLT